MAAVISGLSSAQPKSARKRFALKNQGERCIKFVLSQGWIKANVWALCEILATRAHAPLWERQTMRMSFAAMFVTRDPRQVQSERLSLPISLLRYKIIRYYIFCASRPSWNLIWLSFCGCLSFWVLMILSPGWPQFDNFSFHRICLRGTQTLVDEIVVVTVLLLCKYSSGVFCGLAHASCLCILADPPASTLTKRRAAAFSLVT